MRRTTVIAALFAAAVPCAAWRAQTAAPPKRAHHSIAYDPARGRVLLAGGSTPVDGARRFEIYDDLWELDGGRWRLLSRSGDRLSGASLAWDARQGRMVSFGGHDGRSRGDLRVLEGDRWRTIERRDDIALAEPGFVYDARRARFVAFGGSSGPGHFHGETLEWDGTAWTRRDVAGPPPRAAHAMVYDARRGVTVVFGGLSPSAPGARPASLGDTWEFDGERWTLRDTAGPAPRGSPGVAHDSKRGLVILFGGSGAAGFLGDTWAWDGTRWRQLATEGPSPRAMGYMAYDARRDRVVLFGGRAGWPDGDLGDTWEWDGARWHPVGRE